MVDFDLTAIHPETPTKSENVSPGDYILAETVEDKKDYSLYKLQANPVDDSLIVARVGDDGYISGNILPEYNVFGDKASRKEVVAQVEAMKWIECATYVEKDNVSMDVEVDLR